MSENLQNTPKRAANQEVINKERPEKGTLLPNQTPKTEGAASKFQKRTTTQSESRLQGGYQIPQAEYSSIHSSRFSRYQSEGLGSGLQGGDSNLTVKHAPNLSAIRHDLKLGQRNKEILDLPTKADNPKSSILVPVPRSPQPSPHPQVYASRPEQLETPETVSRATKQAEIASLERQLEEERFMKDELLTENINLRAYIEHLEASDQKAEVSALKAQVQELRDINEECRGSLAVAVEGLKQAQGLEAAHQLLLREKTTLEAELRKEFLAEIDKIQQTHQQEIRTLQGKIPDEEEFFSMQQLLEENGMLREKLTELSSASLKQTFLEQTSDHTNTGMTGRKAKMDPKFAHKTHEDDLESSTKLTRVLQKLRKQIADLLHGIDPKSPGLEVVSPPSKPNTPNGSDILEIECQTLLEEAKQGAQLMKSLSKTSQQRVERLERELLELKQANSNLEIQFRQEMQQNQALTQELERETQTRIRDNESSQAAQDLQRLMKEKANTEEKEDASKNVREYLEQKMAAERLEKMVYREFTEKLKSWVAPECSKMIDEILSLTRQLSSYQKIKSQGLEDILDVSQSKEEEIQANKDSLESKLEQVFSKCSLNSASSRNVEVNHTQENKPVRSLRPSFNRQVLDSPSVRSSSFFAATEEHPDSYRQQAETDLKGRYPSQRKVASETEAASSLIRKELPESFLSSAAPKIAPSPSRSPLDKMMEDHALNFGHLRDKLKDIKAKLNS